MFNSEGQAMSKNILPIAMFLLMYAFSYMGLIFWIDASAIENEGRALANENYVRLIDANLKKIKN